MKFTRTIPPAAAPLTTGDLLQGFASIFDTASIVGIEKGLKDYFGSEFVFLVSSGKAALSLILNALSSIRHRRKVLIPAYTCYSVPSVIVKAGLEIVLCDLDPDTLDFQYSQLEDLIDEETLCVIPTHLFGIPSDVQKVREVCVPKGVFVVEDAAQAMGGNHDGRMLGTLGDVGFFSLGRGKTVTCGSGGIVLTSSPEIGKVVTKHYHELPEEPFLGSIRGIAEACFMRVFLHPSLYWFPSGLPFLRIGETFFNPNFPEYRLNRFNAGVLADWQARMEEHNRCRIRIGRKYFENFSLHKGNRIHPKDVPYLRYPVYADSPEAKAKACNRYRSLGISPMYPDSVNRIEKLRGRFSGLEFPGAERIARTLMTLPTHILLSEKDLSRVCNSLSGIIGNIQKERETSKPEEREDIQNVRRMKC